MPSDIANPAAANRIDPVAATPALGPQPPTPQSASTAAADARAEATATQEALRLNIVRDQASGLFVYKFVNPATGQVVDQMPQEEVLKLRAAAEYAAGRLISTKV